MRISDWSSDVCSSDLRIAALERGEFRAPRRQLGRWFSVRHDKVQSKGMKGGPPSGADAFDLEPEGIAAFEHDMNMRGIDPRTGRDAGRSEEHTSELQSLMRISYAVFCLKQKKKLINTKTQQ